MHTLVLASQVKPGSDLDCYLDHRVIRVSSCDPVSMLLQALPSFLKQILLPDLFQAAKILKKFGGHMPQEKLCLFHNNQDHFWLHKVYSNTRIHTIVETLFVYAPAAGGGKL